MRLWQSALGSVIGCLLVAEVHALEPPATRDRTELLAGIRFGTNHLGFGPGLRGGYTLANGIHLGAALEYFTGERRSETIGAVRTREENSLWVAAVEAGYDLGLTRQLVLRPWGGAGIGWTHGKTCQTTADQSTCTTLMKSDGVFELGVLGEYAFGPCLVGLEARWLLSSDTSVVFGANVGWIFGPN
jgi:opacity protein-like surface antigen